jgi:hypothetical protein
VVGGLAGIGVAYKAWRSKLGRGATKPGSGGGNEETVEDAAQPAES